LYFILLLSLHVPIAGLLLRIVGFVFVFVDPVETLMCSVILLTSGITLLLWEPKAVSPSRGRSRLVFALGLIVVTATITGTARLLIEKRAEEKRAALYAATLRSYSGIMHTGTQRREVEDYLRAKDIPFMQMCCVENKANRGVLDDLTRIGHEKAPWYCSEKNIYVAFQFAGSERHTVGPTAEGSDTLTKVTLFPWLEGCF
jgi:hypothetical protein